MEPGKQEAKISKERDELNEEIDVEPDSEVKKKSKKPRFKVNWHRVFKYLSYLVTCLLLSIYRDVDRYYHFSVKHGSKYYPFSDFKFSFIVMIVIFIYRYGSVYLFRDEIEKIIDIKYQGEERKNHVLRMMKWACDVFYYSFVSIAGYWILYAGGMIPTWLGGQAGCLDTTSQYPFSPEIPYLREYYLVQLGNHFFALVDQFLFKRLEKNYHEMMLHHILTCGLMMLSYQMNLIIPGSVTLLAHDPGDVFLCATRFCADLKNKVRAVYYSLFIFNLFVWIYLRVILLPTCLVYPVLHAFMNMEPEIFSIVKLTMGLQVSMAYLLILMHVYWVCLLLHRGFYTITTKKVRTT